MYTDENNVNKHMFFYRILKNGYVEKTCIFVETTYMPTQHFFVYKIALYQRNWLYR